MHVRAAQLTDVLVNIRRRSVCSHRGQYRNSSSTKSSWGLAESIVFSISDPVREPPIMKTGATTLVIFAIGSNYDDFAGDPTRLKRRDPRIQASFLAPSLSAARSEPWCFKIRCMIHQEPPFASHFPRQCTASLPATLLIPDGSVPGRFRDSGRCHEDNVELRNPTDSANTSRLFINASPGPTQVIDGFSQSRLQLPLRFAELEFDALPVVGIRFEAPWKIGLAIQNVECRDKTLPPIGVGEKVAAPSALNVVRNLLHDRFAPGKNFFAIRDF